MTEPRPRGGPSAYLALARPRQWVKNLLVLAGPFMGKKIGLASFEQALVMLVAFCLVSSASYALNDVLDREADRLHPVKRRRPVASGAVSVPGALLLGLVLLVTAGLIVWWLLPVEALAILIGYFALVTVYSLVLKRHVIIDVIAIAVGFVLRAVGGAAAVSVAVSPWLLVCTFTLCLFLGFGKRRCEISAFQDTEVAANHRRTLAGYTPELLNQLTSVSAGIAVVTFLLYTMDTNPSYAPPFHKQHLMYTVPLVVYGLFRYAMLTETSPGEGPTELILKDRPLVLTFLLWVLLVAGVIWEQEFMAALGLAAR